MKKFLILLLLVLLLPAVGCQKQPSESAETLSLRVGVMPAVDSAPIFYADQKGLFAELGLDVTVQVYTNAMDRQSALISGGLDGAMTDVIALVNNVENGFDIKITTSTDGVFPFLTKQDIAGKTELKAGVMEISVTNYLTDRMLRPHYQLDKIYINEIPARLEMLGQGKLDIAVIPEPMASQGELNGLTKQLFPSDDAFSPEVMVFTGKAIQEKRAALERFHQAYNQAVAAINDDDQAAREILVSTLKLDSRVTDKIILPDYHPARVPDAAYLEQIMAWNEQVLGKKTSLGYDQLVDSSFLD